MQLPAARRDSSQNAGSRGALAPGARRMDEGRPLAMQSERAEERKTTFTNRCAVYRSIIFVMASYFPMIRRHNNSIPNLSW